MEHNDDGTNRVNGRRYNAQLMSRILAVYSVGVVPVKFLAKVMKFTAQT
jgi:hypothetical protein